jgi:hypothetical protein
MTDRIALRRTPATTEPVERAPRLTVRAPRWRDGDMRRWCVPGLLRAEAKFRRSKRLRDMPSLLEALEASARGQPTGIERNAA